MNGRFKSKTMPLGPRIVSGRQTKRPPLTINHERVAEFFDGFTAAQLREVYEEFEPHTWGLVTHPFGSLYEGCVDCKIPNPDAKMVPLSDPKAKPLPVSSAREVFPARTMR